MKQVYWHLLSFYLRALESDKSGIDALQVSRPSGRYLHQAIEAWCI